MDYNAGIVDLCLHQHETFYSIKEFISLISEHELIIKNFLSGNIRAITKYFIDDKESFVDDLYHAISIAKDGRPGPVWIDIPLEFHWSDIQYNSVETRQNQCLNF